MNLCVFSVSARSESLLCAVAALSGHRARVSAHFYGLPRPPPPPPPHLNGQWNICSNTTHACILRAAAKTNGKWLASQPRGLFRLEATLQLSPPPIDPPPGRLNSKAIFSFELDRSIPSSSLNAACKGPDPSLPSADPIKRLDKQPTPIDLPPPLHAGVLCVWCVCVVGFVCVRTRFRIGLTKVLVRSRQAQITRLPRINVSKKSKPQFNVPLNFTTPIRQPASIPPRGLLDRYHIRR